MTDESPIRKCEDPWDRDVPSLQSVIPLETTAAYNMVDVIKEVLNCFFIGGSFYNGGSFYIGGSNKSYF